MPTLQLNLDQNNYVDRIFRFKKANSEYLKSNSFT